MECLYQSAFHLNTYKVLSSIPSSAFRFSKSLRPKTRGALHKGSSNGLPTEKLPLTTAGVL
eukprot:6192117-Pleurochrysis_carterae.AAC.2